MKKMIWKILKFIKDKSLWSKNPKYLNRSSNVRFLYRNPVAQRRFIRYVRMPINQELSCKVQNAVLCAREDRPKWCILFACAIVTHRLVGEPNITGRRANFCSINVNSTLLSARDETGACQDRRWNYRKRATLVTYRR